jgi:ketosteroid isomerase-like protein
MISVSLRAQDKTPISLIDSLNKEMEAAFNKNDMQTVAAFYSDDAEITANNYNVKGRKNIDNYWTSLKDKGRGWKLTVTEIGGRGEYLYQLGTSDLTYIRQGKEEKSVTNFVLIWRLENKQYKIFRDYLTKIKFENP